MGSLPFVLGFIPLSQDFCLRLQNSRIFFRFSSGTGGVGTLPTILDTYSSCASLENRIITLSES